MKVKLVSALALSLRVAVAQAEPSIDELRDSTDAESCGSSTSPARSGPIDSPADKATALHAPADFAAAATAPRGELVRLSRLPEAELMVDVALTSNDREAYFEVHSDDNGASLLICGTPCKFRIWPGRYRLITNTSAGYVSGSNQFVVDRNSQVQVDAPKVYRPTVGAILGIAGIAAAAVGGILIASDSCSSPCSTSTSRHSQVGFAMFGGGVILAPIGWILFAQNRSPNLTVSPIHREGIE